MKYNVLVLRLQFTTFKDKLKKKEKKKKDFYVLVGSIGSHTILHDSTYDLTIFTILVQF